MTPKERAEALVQRVEDQAALRIGTTVLKIGTGDLETISEKAVTMMINRVRKAVQGAIEEALTENGTAPVEEEETAVEETAEAAPEAAAEEEEEETAPPAAKKKATATKVKIGGDAVTVATEIVQSLSESVEPDDLVKVIAQALAEAEYRGAETIKSAALTRMEKLFEASGEETQITVKDARTAATFGIQNLDKVQDDEAKAA